MRRKRFRPHVAAWSTVRISRDGIHHRAVSWRARRAFVARLSVRVAFGLSVGMCIAYVLIGVGNRYPHSLVDAPALSPYTQAQNAARSVRTISHARPPSYPLKASANNRYLVDQDNEPFLMVGDAPQNLIANLSQVEAARYMANRQKYGINTLWINLLCNYSESCNREAKTFDGLAPFDVVGDLSTPNARYFERADGMINMAAAHGMVVLLDPIETSSWLGVLRQNGTAKAFAYGQYLGNRYKSFSNIIWMHGNDFQTWRDPTDTALVQAVAWGIRSTDANHMHTVELNYFTSGSLDDPTWAPLIDLSAAYTYFPTYVQVLNEYNRPNHKPVFIVVETYVFENIRKLQ